MRPTDEQIEAFKKEILEVCKRHGLTFSPDCVASILIEEYSDDGELISVAHWDEPPAPPSRPHGRPW